VKVLKTGLQKLLTMGDADPHILVVDDDRRIRELLVSYLQANGFRVTSAANAAVARKAMDGLCYDVIVLDIMMPGENGLSFATSLRGDGDTVPILMLSARSDTSDRIQGLATGSDDYLGKPFEPEELLLRLRNLLRRVAPKAEKIKAVKFGECSFEIESGVLERNGELVKLTGREKDILRLLASTPGVPVARAALQPDGVDEGARAIDVQMTRLRQKIEKDPGIPVHLQTVRGQGYCLFAEPF
jgi:two-component system, OmpR family, phosphate regulon response regulator OmpR